MREFLRQRPQPRRYQPWTIARAVARAEAGEDFWFAVRELLDDVAHGAATGDWRVAGLVAERPADQADVRLHAFVGALAEHLADTHDEGRTPGWAREPERFLATWWFAVPAAFEALALRDAPPAFRRRGIFIDPLLLSRC